MKVEGKIFKIFETQKISDTFSKREFVIEFAENPLYPQFILLQLVKDNIKKIDSFKEGEKVEVEFNLRGREWISPSGEKKYFNSLEAWKITPLQKTQSAPPPPPVDELGLNDPLPPPF